MKIAIFGSRKIDIQKVYECLSDWLTPEHEYLTSGNIEGAAKMANIVAQEKGLTITIYYYSSDGYYQAIRDIMIKNERIVASCNFAYVFWNGESKGTAREMKMLEKEGKKYKLTMCNKTILSKSLIENV